MRKNRVIEQNRCYHLVSRLAHRAFFLDDEEKVRAVALMRRVEAGVQASMSYCINRTVSISSDPFDPLRAARQVARLEVPERRVRRPADGGRDAFRMIPRLLWRKSRELALRSPRKRARLSKGSRAYCKTGDIPGFFSTLTFRSPDKVNATMGGLNAS